MMDAAPMAVRWAYRTTATLITAAVCSAVIFAFAVPSATAQVCPPGKTAAECTVLGLGQTAETAGLSTQERTLPEILGILLNAALSLTGVIFVILMVYGGFLWMQARGNQDDVAKAKKIIEHAIIGIILIALAFAITNFVISRIGRATGG